MNLKVSSKSQGLAIIGVWTAVMVLAGCGVRGLPGENPPIHPNPNMDTQEKMKPFRKSEFFEDGLAMRIPVAGTVPRGGLRENSVYYTGISKTGDTVKVIPIDVTMELLQRGQERYNIYCAPCHSRVGDGKGIIVERAVQGGYLVPATNLHEPRLLAAPDGHLFAVASNGIRNMAGYKHQISVQDRWAIVAYIRALQRAQHASIADVPENVRKELIKQ